MTVEWHDALTRRLRALLKSGPLHELKRNQGRLEVALEHDDLTALAMRALEVLVDALGVRAGATRDEIAAALAPLAEANDRAAGIPQWTGRNPPRVGRLKIRHQRAAPETRDNYRAASS